MTNDDDDWECKLDRLSDDHLSCLFDQIVTLVRDSSNDGNGEEAEEESASNDDKLRFYGLFKHVHDGPCPTDDDHSGQRRPSIFQVVARAKYNAWESYRDYTKQEAQKEYITLLLSIQDPTKSKLGSKCR